MNVMVQAAMKAGRSLSRDFGEVQNLQVSVKGPGDYVSQADRKAEDILLNDAGICPLYYSTSVMLVRTSVKNAVYNRGNWDFKEAYVK